VVRVVDVDVDQALDDPEREAGEGGEEGYVQPAAEQAGPAGEQEVDAGRLGDLLDDRRAEYGQQEEAAGLELADRGADDAEGAAR
jgi:hypothetical protein